MELVLVYEFVGVMIGFLENILVCCQRPIVLYIMIDILESRKNAFWPERGTDNDAPSLFNWATL
jgi:hypothetical protein